MCDRTSRSETSSYTGCGRTSSYTSCAKRGLWVCRLLSVLITLLPVVYYVIKGFADESIGTKQKACLGCMVCLAITLYLINVLMKYSIRSTIWILLLGVYVCLEDILPLILMLAIGTIIDEFILTPLKKHYASVYKINREIDRRE